MCVNTVLYVAGHAPSVQGTREARRAHHAAARASSARHQTSPPALAAAVPPALAARVPPALARVPPTTTAAAAPAAAAAAEQRRPVGRTAGLV